MKKNVGALLCVFFVLSLILILFIDAYKVMFCTDLSHSSIGTSTLSISLASAKGLTVEVKE